MYLTLAPSITTRIERKPRNTEAKRADQSAAAVAAAAYYALEQQCATQTAALNAMKFGPFGDSDTCSYGCCGEDHWWWSWDLTTWAKQQFFGPSIAVMDNSHDYYSAFAAVQNWLTNALPKFDDKINTGINTILTLDTQITHQGTPPTPQQLTALAQTFAALQDALGQDLNALNGTIQTLAHFIVAANARSNYLSNQISWAKSDLDTKCQQGAQDLINKIECDQGRVQNGFNAVQALLDSNCAALQQGATAIGGSYNAALNAVQKEVGVQIILQDDSTLVTQHLQAAQSLDPTSSARMVHLHIALQNWQQLVSNAHCQFS